MAIKFAWRSDTTTADARYAKGIKDAYKAYSSVATTVSLSADTAAIGGQAWHLSAVTDSLGFDAGLNFTEGKAFTMLCRVNPRYSGTPAFARNIWGYNSSTLFNRFYAYHDTTGDIKIRHVTRTNNITNATAGAWNPTTTAYYDIVVSWDGTTTSNLEVFVDGVTLGALSPNYGMTAGVYAAIGSYALGSGSNWANSGYNFNEFVVWDEVIDVTNVTLVDASTTATSTGQTLNGASRTGWVDVESRDWQSNTDPGVANVLSGTGYTIQGLSYTGSYDIPTYTDPGVANVVSGTSYIFNDATLTGTYAVAAYTDPGIANVRLNTEYIFNDSTLTGTLNVPAAASGTAGTVDINQLKEQIRYVLAEANTTTGSPIDLSNNMTRRVQHIAKVNPEKIHDFTANIVPAVTVYTERKDIEQKTIAVNQVSGKREAKMNFNIVGMVWVPYTTDFREDPADEDIEVLMENVERVLRSFADLSGNAKWQFPTGVQYHSVAWDEENHYRVGMMDLEATVFY